MKASILFSICSIVFLFSAAPALAQKNVLSLGVMAMDLRIEESSGLGPSLSFESQIKEKITIGVQAAMLYSNTSLARTIPGDWTLRESVLLIQPTIKFYSKEAFKGFNIGIRGNYVNYDQVLLERNSGGETSVSMKDINPSFLGAGINLGFSTPIRGRLSFGISGNGDILFDVNSQEESTIAIGVEAKVGYRF